jgi:urease alpha subunit
MKKFVLYTNPNNVTNAAYCAAGAFDANQVLKSAKSYPGSYIILYKGKGNDEKIAEIKSQFRNYKFV